MRWFVVFGLLFIFYSYCGWMSYNKVTNSGSWVFRELRPEELDRTAKGYTPKPPWKETPISLRTRWILKYTYLLVYFMVVTDMIGAIGCFAARYGLGHRWWFRVFLCLCMVMYVIRIIAVIPEWGNKYPAIFFPPTIGSILILPLLLYDKLFPCRAKIDLESDRDGGAGWP